MVMSEKPAHIKLVGESLEDTDFSTPGHRDAAEWILRLWPETHNLNEIARRSDWSPSHIQNVFSEYFEAASERQDYALGGAPEYSQQDIEAAYQDGYRDGYRDGFEDGQES